MTRFVIDAGVALRLAAEGVQLAPRVKLLAPTLLRSQALSAQHEAKQRRDITADQAHAQLRRLARLPIRLLGDAVLRRRAWDIADELGWASTYDAEYLALTQLQADAFVTVDAKLARRARALVTVASFDELIAPRRSRRS